MNDRDLLRLVHRAIALLGKVDENKPEESINLIDTARDDLLEVRTELRTRVDELSAAGDATLPHGWDETSPYDDESAVGGE